MLLFDIDIIYLSPPESLASGVPGIFWRQVLLSQQLRNFTNLNASFCSILKTTSYYLECSCILFRYFRSIEEHLKYSQSTSDAHRFAFSLFGSVWELLEGSVLPFGIAESLSYDFRTISHCADANMLSRTIPIALDGTLAACLTICS
jgi:hypothetical protein